MNEQPKTTVVNVRSEPYDVCIMRPSILGNPFVIGRDGTREEVIEKFREYFEQRMFGNESFGVDNLDLAFREAVENLRGRKIGCCCSPAACHGDVYAEFLNDSSDNKTCSTCKSWLDFCQAFEDDLEPRDFGYCQEDKCDRECTSEDEICEHWSKPR